ncbi:DUF475 domain-containing protein [Synechococcus sp. M16CYN]|uniref:DUF475 domain-containing protein n=1 Tax=Synechococcus sp. M16CYN TaxID=3103139 RepID=UPI00324DEF1D
MDITGLPFLSDFLDGVNQWQEVLVLLPVLILLEILLSADNAVALAAIARNGRNPDRERLSLDIGIAIALVFRISLIISAQWILHFVWVQLTAAGYLVWLVINHFRRELSVTSDRLADTNKKEKTSRSLASTIILVAFTDLAFSIDSVAAAVAISDEIILIITGAVVGIIALRFTSGLFIRWLDKYPRLETAGFLSIAFVALRLIIHAFLPFINQPDWLTLVVVLILLGWGFSAKNTVTIMESHRVS